MDKKQQIIVAAMKLLTEGGVQATPMSAIAREAGTGMGTIYNYFATKEELINAIYMYIKQEELKAVSVPFASDSVKKHFEHFYETMIQYMVGNPMHFWFMEQFSASPIISEATREEGVRTFASYTAILKQGQEQGIIKAIPIEELMQFVHGGIKAFIRWALVTGRPLTPQLMHNQLTLSWDAIKG